MAESTPLNADEELAAVLARHTMARPNGEPVTWCVCLRWSTTRGTRVADWRSYELHLAGDLARIVAARETAARADEREWFKNALTNDVGDLLDVDWLREKWWVKHVIAAHLDGPPTTQPQPTEVAGELWLLDGSGA